MNDLDAPLGDRLHELARHAPVPAADPPADIRRAKVALRRRRTRAAAGVTTSLIAAGAVAVVLPHVNDSSTAHDPAPRLAASPSAAPARTGASALCDDPVSHTVARRAITRSTPPRSVEPWHDPAVAPTLSAYRRAALAVLDPSGRHLDGHVSNVQYGCGPSAASDRLTELGTQLARTPASSPSR